MEGYLEANVSNAHRDEGEIRMIVEFMQFVSTGTHPCRWTISRRKLTSWWPLSSQRAKAAAVSTSPKAR